MKSFADLEKNNGRVSFDELFADPKIGISQNRGQYLPGRIYSLQIRSPAANLNEEKVMELNNGRKYYDLNPVGLSLFTENFKEVSVFINFKVIPPNILAKLLEGYYYFASKNGMANLYREGKLIDIKERTLLDQRFYFTPASILVQLVGLASLNYAINKYNNDQIIEAKMIDWDKFGMLVNPKASISGLHPQPINIDSVYEDFIKNSINKF